MSQGIKYVNAHARSAVAALAALAASSPAAAQSGSVEDLARLSLEELSNVTVTSVSKSAEVLRLAPASIYVISRDEIVRSGATSIPEALRLAPNIEIRQQNANSYVAAARGFAGNPVAQNFSNKLLVLIDGRSVYTPLFSGVYFDAQDTLLADIERIEVISGPGATLWGANAMNGVINIITRAADLTQGSLMSVGAGNLERNVSARYGSSIGEDAHYRVYGKAFKRDPMQSAGGASAQDGWDKVQGGARMDWRRGKNSLTTQGDIYRAREDQSGPRDLEVIGANLLTRWQHQGESSDWQVQAYIDQTQRAEPPGGAAFVLHTYDLEIQQRLAIGSTHKVVWGAGNRINSYNITNSATLLFVPHSRTLNLANAFVQDTIAFGAAVNLTLGLKLENDPYSDWAALPDARLSWQLSDTAMVWASAARAIRSPTPFDQDVQERLGTVLFLTGNDSFEPERVDAFEIGYRGQPLPQLSVSLSAFYNEYDDLRTIEPAPIVFLPLRWDNEMQGHAYGMEAWAKWQVLDWWRLSPGVRVLHKDLRFKAGASRLLGLSQAANDPTSQASLTSSMDIGGNVTLDTFLRYVATLPDPALDEYYELNVRIGWRVTAALDLALSGFNLLDSSHSESPGDAQIRRSAYAEARWRF